uniref:Uncharacterized protein n=1 Tax=Lactuca sativa TaxID=4236 RepID=A0A9R1XCD0_LACSA|nr:hypothetical protein LSAT_V11C500255350 [Lactuca sativa]
MNLCGGDQLPVVPMIRRVSDTGHGRLPVLRDDRKHGAFKPSCNISVTLNDVKTRKQVPLKKENGQISMVPRFQNPVQGKKVEHNDIKIELLGQIEIYFDRGNFYDFTSPFREPDVPGEIYEKKTFPFEFSSVEMPYETYNSVNVRLRSELSSEKQATSKSNTANSKNHRFSLETTDFTDVQYDVFLQSN